MSNAYKLVQWNAHKKVYDLVVVGAIVLTVAASVGASFALGQTPDPMIAMIRGFGLTAIIMLHVILSIGPLARLSGQFNALLYNRRHLGVSFFFVALVHAGLVFLYYGGFGPTDPFTAVLGSSAAGFDATGRIPWEWFGFLALLIFFVMAATSHDFWLKNLGPRFWKTLHMLVYAAYALVIAHVAFGSARDHGGTLPIAFPYVMLGAGVAWVAGLHLIAGLKGAGERAAEPSEGWVEVPEPSAIDEGRARIVPLPGGASAAVFREGDTYRAMSNVCAHQGGPVGEGKIVDGCATCPWHGYQYRTENGCSPPPYTEKLPTYELRVSGGRLEVRAEANEPGTPVEVVRLGSGEAGHG